MKDIDTDSYSESYWTESYNPKRQKKPSDNPQGAVFDHTDHGRIRVPVVNVEPKQDKRDEAERLTTEFLNSGGAITICKPGRYRKFRFGGPRPIAGMTGGRDNCLSRPQWQGIHLSPDEERDSIRAAAGLIDVAASFIWWSRQSAQTHTPSTPSVGLVKSLLLY